MDEKRARRLVVFLNFSRLLSMFFSIPFALAHGCFTMRFDRPYQFSGLPHHCSFHFLQSLYFFLFSREEIVLDYSPEIFDFCGRSMVFAGNQ